MESHTQQFLSLSCRPSDRASRMAAVMLLLLMATSMAPPSVSSAKLLHPSSPPSSARAEHGLVLVGSDELVGAKRPPSSGGAATISGNPRSPTTSSAIPPSPGITAAAIPRRLLRAAQHHARSSSGSPSPPHREGSDGAALCVERVSTEAYLGVTTTPQQTGESSSRGEAFVWEQQGRIWQGSLPGGPGAVLKLDGLVLDLSDRVSYDAARGMGLLSAALNPRFDINELVYVSYTCDSFISPACTGGSSAAARYHLVVEEFTVARSPAADNSKARRMFTAELPENHSSSAQLLFRTGEWFLYLMLDTGGTQDFSRGQIIRFSVDQVAGDGRGNSSTMPEPEVVATGLGHLRGCAFDTEGRFDFYCAIVDELQHEQVCSILVKPVNDGGSAYEKLQAVTSLVIDYGRPVPGTDPSIVGGFLYRGSADTSRIGRYLHNYRSTTWAAAESPPSSGQYVAVRIPSVACSRTTPVRCSGRGGIGGRVLSLAEAQNTREGLIFATDGIYRIVAPSLCKATHQAFTSGTAWLIYFLGSVLVMASYLVWTRILFPSSAQGSGDNNCNIAMVNIIRERAGGSTTTT